MNPEGGTCDYYRHTELQATEAGCPFCHPTSPRIFNMGGGHITPATIAFIEENTEDGQSVLLKNFARAQVAR